jgi:hypothetical protein
VVRLRSLDGKVRSTGSNDESLFHGLEDVIPFSDMNQMLGSDHALSFGGLDDTILLCDMSNNVHYIGLEHAIPFTPLKSTLLCSCC